MVLVQGLGLALGLALVLALVLVPALELVLWRKKQTPAA